MISEKTKEIWLCQKRIPDDGGNLFLDRALPALVLFAGLTVSVIEVTGTVRPIVVLSALLSGFVLILFRGILTKLQKHILFYPAALLMVLICVIVFRDFFLEGLRVLWNQAGNTWTARTGIATPDLAMQLPEENQSAAVACFAAISGAMTALICCVVSQCSKWASSLLLSGSVLAGTALLHWEPPDACLTAVISGAVLLFLQSGLKRRNGWLSLLLGFGIFLGMSAMALFAGNTEAMDRWGAEVKTSIEQHIHHQKYETEYTVLPEGRLREFRIQTQDPVPGLKVTMEYAEPMYLRGFVGCTFVEDTWYPLDTQALAENETLLYWLNRETFNPAAQYSGAALDQQVVPNRITVQNLGACSTYAYTPFHILNQSAEGLLQPENLYTDSIAADGQRTVVYATARDGVQAMAEVLVNLRDSHDDSVLRYRKAESAYRSFVDENYLQIPQSAVNLLETQFDKLGLDYGSREEWTEAEGQTYALRFLSLCFPEAGTPETVELPLMNLKGSSYQYATTAVLALRYFGVPARYAEGYVITQQMADRAEEKEAILVDSSCAKAWVEVYQDGIGWIPMDLLPGLSEITQQQQPGQVQSPEASDGTVSAGQELEAPEEKPEPDGGSLVTLEDTIHWIVWLLIAALLAAVLVLWIRRQRILRQREARRMSENKNDAVAWIFRDTAEALKQMGFDRGNGSMTEICGQVGSELGEDFEKNLRGMIDLNARAMFSSGRLEESHREKALAFHAETLNCLKARENWKKRLWIQWILCLY